MSEGRSQAARAIRDLIDEAKSEAPMSDDVRTIPRYFIDDSGCLVETDHEGLGDVMRAEDVEAIFQRGVAYMPVPRCDSCRWWDAFNVVRQTGDCTLFECRDGAQVYPLRSLELTGTRSGFGIVTTQADFGCVQHEPIGA